MFLAKWCKPNYNSVVATFCHNIAHGLPIQINDSSRSINLVYVDDVVSSLLATLEEPEPGFFMAAVEPEYAITLGQLAEQIYAFADCRTSLMSERVGMGWFVRFMLLM